MQRDLSLKLTLALGSVACLLGCPQQEEDPCRDDAFLCAQPGELPMDSSCTLTGELEVEVGWGLDAFITFEMPAPVWAGFQGGQHTFLAVRIPNAALDQYEALEVTFQLAALQPNCVEDWDSVILSTDLIAECYESANTRRVVFGQDQPIRTGTDGALTEFGLFLEYPGGGFSMVSARALDPCGRTGEDVAFFRREQ